MISDSPNRDPELNEQGADPRPFWNWRTIWEYDWETESVRELPATPLGIAWSGIVIAATCYPMVLGCFHVMWLVIPSGFTNFDLSEIGMVLGSLMFSMVAAMTYAVIMSMPAVGLTYLLGWSLKGVISDRGLSGVYGGMTGFMCVSGGGLFYATERIPVFPSWELPLFLLLVSLLAVVMGHVGAILAGYRRRNDGFPFFKPIFSCERQITIGYLMKLTFIVAVLAVVLKVTGPVGINVGIAWVLYILLQTVLLIGDNWITRWLSQR